MNTTSHAHSVSNCPQCKTEVRPEMIRCRQCGTMLHGAHVTDSSTMLETDDHTSCLKCGEELRPGMLRCRSCGHSTHGTKPKPHSVKLADSASWAADLFDNVPLEEIPVEAVTPVTAAATGASVKKTEVAKPVPTNSPSVKSVTVSPPELRLCPDCKHPLEVNSTTCVWCAEVQVACQVAYEQAKVKIAESMVSQAMVTYKAAEERAKKELAWAFAPNVDKHWWGWMGGVEFGPVEFMQVFALAKNGQLKPSDLIRNGSHGQFFPSSAAPGLLSAVAIVSKASEALELAKAQAQAAAAMAPPPTKAQLAAASKVAASVASEKPAAAPVPVKANPVTNSSSETAKPSHTNEMSTPSSAQPNVSNHRTPSSVSTIASTSPEQAPAPRHQYVATPPVALRANPRPAPKKESWDPSTVSMFNKILAGSLACVLVAGGLGLKHAFRKVHRTVVRSAPASNSVAGINSAKPEGVR